MTAYEYQIQQKFTLYSCGSNTIILQQKLNIHRKIEGFAKNTTKKRHKKRWENKSHSTLEAPPRNDGTNFAECVENTPGDKWEVKEVCCGGVYSCMLLREPRRAEAKLTMEF